MAKFLFHVNFSPEGNRGVLAAGGTARVRAIEELVTSLGGSLECLYFVLGGDESFAVCDLPGNEAATAFALNAGASGAVEVRTTALLTPAEVDAATKLSAAFRAPGN
jgi:uncharacterized protein with GYD domain